MHLVRYLGELARRYQAKGAERERLSIRSPQDVYGLLGQEMKGLLQEQLRVLLLDTKNSLLKVSLIYQGSLWATPVRTAELFREAVTCNALSIILVHNHPSGDPTPSQEDMAVTEEARKAGEIMGIEVLDHIIIGHDRFVSLRERGWPPKTDKP